MRGWGMVWTLPVRWVLPALAWMVALPASAATITVPGDFGTIQAAVDAATEGDLVKVFGGGGTGPNGEYQENVVIDTTRITLHCLGAVIDASTTVTTRAAMDFSAGITVTVDGVAIRGCTVQFAHDCTAPECPNNDDDGDGIDVDAHDFSGLQLTLIANEGNGIEIDGHAATIENSTGRTNVRDFDLNGNDSLLSGVTSLGSRNDGVRIRGDRNTVEASTVERAGGDGFDVNGEDNELSGNQAIANASDGFEFNGDGIIVDNNMARANGGDGFELDGANNSDLTLTRNEARDHDDHGFRLMQLTDSTVANNLAANNTEDGFQCSECDGVTFRSNVARENGDDGFQSIDGDDNLYDGNRSADNDDDGFEIGICTDTTLNANEALRNGEDGIDVNCFGNGGVEIIGNTVNQNRGTGIENDAVLTDITGNRALGNRTDIAGAGNNSGTVDDFTGNVFNTGGVATATPGT